jgi:hypothetical protein
MHTSPGEAGEDKATVAKDAHVPVHAVFVVTDSKPVSQLLVRKELVLSARTPVVMSSKMTLTMETLTTALDVVVEPVEAEADAVVEMYWLAILDTERVPLGPQVPPAFKSTILRMHLRGGTGFSKETKLLSLQRPAKSGPGRAMDPASYGLSVVAAVGFFEKAAILSPLSKVLSSVACCPRGDWG